MAMMPDYCVDSYCKHTNWGGRGRQHEIQRDCPVYVRELHNLQRHDQFDFFEALRSLPKDDQNAEIGYSFETEKVTMNLETFLALAKHFQGHIEYGIKQTHGGEGGDDASVYSLNGMPFKDARDLAEVAGKQLMQRFDSGWIEA
jgi:hypothetical protein